MHGMFSKVICRVFGHAGPKGVLYKEGVPSPRYGGNASFSRIDWECPRCGQNAWALKIRPDDSTEKGK
jgi:hypothetical protein